MLRAGAALAYADVTTLRADVATACYDALLPMLAVILITRARRAARMMLLFALRARYCASARSADALLFRCRYYATAFFRRRRRHAYAYYAFPVQRFAYFATWLALMLALLSYYYAAAAMRHTIYDTLYAYHAAAAIERVTLISAMFRLLLFRRCIVAALR